MKHSLKTALALWIVTLISGCSIAGSWQTVSVDPPGIPFGLKTLTLDNKDNYTATWSEDGSLSTTTGKYKWNGRSLQMGRSGLQSRRYKARRRLDGKLVIYFEHNNATMTTVLEQSKKPEEQ